MDVETSPSQPPAVTLELAEALDDGRRSTDPWWQAGIEEALGGPGE